MLLLILAQADKKVLPIHRLNSEEQATVVVALGALVILGLLGILIASLCARAVRYYASHSPPRRAKSSSIDPDDWAKKPLYPDQVPSPHEPSSETERDEQ